MGEESSGTQRRALPARSALAVIISLHIFSAGFSHANGKSFAPDLNPAPNSQRCGDSIFFFFTDQTGKDIDLADFESVVILLNNWGPGYKLNKERKGEKGFALQTLCGQREIKVTVSYRSKEMELILKRIPGDQGNIFLYAIPFSEGAYTFDFEDNLDKTCRENAKGQRGKCILPPKRLKKVTPDSREQEVTRKHAE